MQKCAYSLWISLSLYIERNLQGKWDYLRWVRYFHLITPERTPLEKKKQNYPFYVLFFIITKLNLKHLLDESLDLGGNSCLAIKCASLACVWSILAVTPKNRRDTWSIAGLQTVLLSMQGCYVNFHWVITAKMQQECLRWWCCASGESFKALWQRH